MILPQLKSALMISIGQLYDGNFDVHLNKRKLYAFKESELILEGNRNTSDGLWDILVQKKKMTKNYYTLPVAYHSIYKTRTHKARDTAFLKHTTKSKNTMHSSNEDKINHIDYINHNSLDNTLHQQYQQDVKQYKVLAYIRTIILLL